MLFLPIILYHYFSCTVSLSFALCVVLPCTYVDKTKLACKIYERSWYGLLIMHIKWLCIQQTINIFVKPNISFEAWSKNVNLPALFWSIWQEHVLYLIPKEPGKNTGIQDKSFVSRCALCLVKLYSDMNRSSAFTFPTWWSNEKTWQF